MMENKLFEALKNKNFKFFRAILTRGQNINVQNSHGNTLLHKAVKQTNFEIVKYLINHGADVNLKNKKNQSALLIALNIDDSAGKNSIIRILIEAGADVNTENEFGYRAIHIGVKFQNIDLVKLCVSKGADVNTKVHNWYYWTPLHWAAYLVRSNDSTIFEILLSANADVNAINAKGETPLHALLIPYWGNNKPFNLGEIVKIFLKFGADVNAQVASTGRTPMDYAVRYRHLSAVEALITCGGVNVNSKEGGWSTIFCVASSNFYLPIIKYLLKNGADINSLDDHDRSPLRLYIENLITRMTSSYVSENNSSIGNEIEYLLKWDPDINTFTKDGRNILNVPGIYYPKDLSGPIIRHIAKLKVAERLIHPSVLETISSHSEYTAYFEKCNQELLKAKNSKLHHDNLVTFWNVLMDNKMKLFHYAGNAELSDYWSEKKVAKIFPIYGVYMHKKFAKAIEKRKIWDHAAKTLCDLLPLAIDPDHQVTIKILSFIDSKNLTKLCQ